MAIVVGVLLVAAVLLALGLAAAGRIDGMYRATPDAPPGLPEGPITPEGLRRVKLPVVLRGYRMADVDELIERAAAELETSRPAKPTPYPAATTSLEKAPAPDPAWDG